MNIKEELLKFIGIGDIIIFNEGVKGVIKRGVILKVSNDSILTSIGIYTINAFIELMNHTSITKRLIILKKHNNNIDIDGNSVSFIEFRSKYYSYAHSLLDRVGNDLTWIIN